jgi:hypothetical protein
VDNCYDTANYIRNRSPTSSLNGKTPFELFFNKIPSHKHLTIYGCEAYPLDLPKLSNKFAPRAKENCIMVGYGESDSIYWIYDKSKKKMFKSRDVRFNENSVLNDNEKEFDIKITGLETPINNNEDIEENIQNDENNENENDDYLNDDTNDDDSDNDNNNDLNENILNENIEIDNNEGYVEKNTEKPPQQQTTNDAWEGDVDTLHSKSDSDILSEKRVRKPTKRYVPGEAITKKKKSNQQKLANLVNIIDDEPET